MNGKNVALVQQGHGFHQGRIIAGKEHRPPPKLALASWSVGNVRCHLQISKKIWFVCVFFAEGSNEVLAYLLCREPEAISCSLVFVLD